jgi:AcrR family transcriptional regulator
VPPVKRPYDAPIRREQSALTRRRILDAAVTAFSASGWTGTTVAEVARSAGVTPQAVHLSVGAKPALLVAAVAHAVAGDEPDVPLRQRRAFAPAFEPGVPAAARAAAFAAGSRAVYERAGALFLVLAQAAPLDQAVQEIWRSAREARLADCRDLVRLASPSGTASDRTTSDRTTDDRTADIVFVLSGPGVYADLTGDRGWPAGAYEGWLTDALRLLLGD